MNAWKRDQGVPFVFCTATITKRNCGYEHTVVSRAYGKTRRLLSENLNLVDVVIELLDAGYLQAAKIPKSIKSSGISQG